MLCVELLGFRSIYKTQFLQLFCCCLTAGVALQRVFNICAAFCVVRNVFATFCSTFLQRFRIRSATSRSSMSWNIFPAVFKGAFHFLLVPLTRGVRGRVRSAILLRRSMIWGRFRPESGGDLISIFMLTLSTAGSSHYV
jgi:hypothetical protein